jgi:gamma-glutamyltranspeptidase
MVESLAGGRELGKAMALPRMHNDGAPDVILYEPGVNGAILDGLRRRGHLLRSIPALGRVNAFYCSSGLLENSESCAVANDPRGFGLAYVVQ